MQSFSKIGTGMSVSSGKILEFSFNWTVYNITFMANTGIE